MNIKAMNSALLFVAVAALLLTACSSSSGPMGSGGTAWGVDAFRSNGERIYFTSTSERGTAITYTDGPSSGGLALSTSSSGNASPGCPWSSRYRINSTRIRGLSRN